jgi:Ca2+:H+ antiporter
MEETNSARSAPTDAGGWRELLTPLNALLVAVPAAVALKLFGVGGVWMFAAAALGIVPLAGLIGKATEALAARTGPGAGALLNATFGNASELIIAAIILTRGPGLYPVVKSTLTGSIIGNLLLVLGAAILAGGFRQRAQRFDRGAAGVGATLMAIAAAGLLLPTLFSYLPAPGESGRVENLSEEIAVILIAVYGLSLLYDFKTRGAADEEKGGGRAGGAGRGPAWGVRAALGVMLAATVAVGFLSEWLVGAIEPAAGALGMNGVFVGVVVVAIVGNAAEHYSAVQMAWGGKLDVSVRIAVSSSTQIALFVAPLLVLASLVMGLARPLDLHFTPLEVVAVLLSVALVSLVSHDGEANWLEGVMLLALYLILALAFYNLPVKSD